MTRRGLRRVATGVATTLVLGGLGATAVACNRGEDTETVTAYEDCDEEDQGAPRFLGREDDCGFWLSPTGAVASGAYPGDTWVWVWFSWVDLGHRSYPHAGWTPPRGISPPRRTITVPRGKVRPCALGGLAPTDTSVSIIALAPPPPPPSRPNPPPPPPAVRPNPPQPGVKVPPGQRPPQPPARPAVRRGC